MKQSGLEPVLARGAERLFGKVGVLAHADDRVEHVDIVCGADDGRNTLEHELALVRFVATSCDEGREVTCIWTATGRLDTR